MLDTVDALLDGVCGREGDAQVDVRGQPFLQRLDGCLDVVTGLDDVGVLRLLDVNRDRRLAVHARKRRLFLFAVDDLGDLRQIDRAAALLGDDDPAELCRILDLPLDAHDRIALSARNAAGRHVLIGIANRIDDLIDAQAQRRQRIRLDLYEDLSRHPAVDVDPRDARQVFQRLDDRLIGERRELAKPGRLRRDGQRDHRLRIFRVGAHDQRILDVFGKTGTHRRDLVAHVLDRLCIIRRQAEFDEHLARVFE